MDGVGQLNHLDDLLTIENFRAIQWVYGDGKPDAIHWLPVYEKIRAAGKEIQLLSVKDFFDILPILHGSPLFQAGLSSKDWDLAGKILSAR